jgi:hypothetical protein
MAFDPISAIGTAVVGNVVGGLFGGDSGPVLSQTGVATTIPGTEFQPVTYRGATGGVTGTQEGDFGYNWSADIAPWITELGNLGADSASGLFSKYLAQVGMDPYAASNEFYQRGLAQLQPELLKQQIQSQERQFGTGRLGLKLAGEAVGAPTGTGQVNPDAFGLAAGQSKALTDLWRTSLTEGQAFNTNVINQLKTAAQDMLALGLKPAEVEQNLIKFAADLEGARSTAIKGGVGMSPFMSTPETAFGGQVGNIASGMFSDWWSGGTPSDYSGNWVNPDSGKAWFNGIFS